ncbi:MAG: prepilin-type N-terminal cleavage/methylation domain-containing protein [Atopobiaceae bacterium]|nr:prepilin-type N-terminal cleavage/methylation domain-containing protein [Atopobiaceae bacterium]
MASGRGSAGGKDAKVYEKRRLAMKQMIQARKEELQKRGVKGFTLMEMLIVVAIIAVLVAIAIPIFTSQLNKARVEADAANIRSGYATVSAKVLTDDVTTDQTYYLKADGTVDTNSGDFKCQGTTGTDPGSQNIAGQTCAWSKGTAVSYTYTASTLKVTISVAS